MPRAPVRSWTQTEAAHHSNIADLFASFETISKLGFVTDKCLKACQSTSSVLQDTRLYRGARTGTRAEPPPQGPALVQAPAADASPLLFVASLRLPARPLPRPGPDPGPRLGSELEARPMAALCVRPRAGGRRHHRINAYDSSMGSSKKPTTPAVKSKGS